MLDRSQLRGLSLDVAELYGKPGFGACYTGRSVSSNRLEEGAVCAVCGKPATNAHHAPPRSKGLFELETPNGSWLLRPSLLAVCGSGTTGCHGGFHGGARFFPRWVWDTQADMDDWWSGEMLTRLEPHSLGIYAHGHWEVEDRATGSVRRFRGWSGCHL